MIGQTFVMDNTISAEVAETVFEFDDDTINIRQVKVNIWGNEFYLDPDQVVTLLAELEAANEQLGEK
jgi:hypothetical protein